MRLRFTEPPKQISREEYRQGMRDPMKWTDPKGYVRRMPGEEYLHEVPSHATGSTLNWFQGADPALKGYNRELYYHAAYHDSPEVNLSSAGKTQLLEGFCQFFLGCSIEEARKDTSLSGLPFYGYVQDTLVNVLVAPEQAQRTLVDVLNVASDGTDLEFCDYLQSRYPHEPVAVAYRNFADGMTQHVSQGGTYVRRHLW